MVTNGNTVLTMKEKEAGNKLKKLKFFVENGFLIGDPFFLNLGTHGRVLEGSPGILEGLGGQ